MGLAAQAIALGPVGYFRIWAKAPGGSSKEITFFRGVPTQITSLTTQDPFGDAQLTLSFPQITAFDRPGAGDLDWLVPYTDIDVIWENVGENSFTWRWSGFAIDESISCDESQSSMSLECKGALFQLDNFLAKPFFPAQPWPYEQLLRRAMHPNLHPGLRTKPLIIEWPADWTKTVPVFKPPSQYGLTAADLWFLKPIGVTTGEKWTGLTARATGGWDPTLTGYIQGMLTIMYDEGGSQWTIRMDEGRQPVLYLRRPPLPNHEGVLGVDLGTPGIQISLSRDFTQAANVIYGVGQDNAGVAFSGMAIDNDGNTTAYEPFAASRAVYPDDANPAFNGYIMRKETQFQFPQGMDEITARELAAAQLQRFADPGYTGSITLRTDPYLREDRTTFPRMLVRAGQSIVVRGIRGDTHGILFHITESTIDFREGTTTLTIDSKYRDQLTVAEVRARTRDALTPLRMLQTGKLSITVNDLLKPWSYTDGSGMVPQGSKEFFNNRIPDKASFPWEEWTKKYPPKNADSSKFYIRIDPPNKTPGEAYKNWSGIDPSTNAVSTLYKFAIPIYMAQAGQIRLSQIAAYDKDGNVMPVRFHVSLWYNSGTSAGDMPMITSLTTRTRPPAGGQYQIGDRTPWFEGAFESMRPDGSEYENPGDIVPQTAGFAIGWGTFYEPAGYSPGLFSRNPDVKTGMLTDEATWTFDTTSWNDFNKFSRQDNLNNPYAGMMYVMVYCDDHPNGEPVYFMGRFYRTEPGTTG